MLPLRHNLTVSSSERKHNNEAKTDVHSTAFCLALGLTTGAWAADGLSGQSYTVSDGMIRLFAPQGYEGTETIALPSDYCGHTGHSVTWTVQDGKGTLKLNHCWRYDSTGWYGICIDGGSTLADAVIELEGSFTYSYLHTTGWTSPCARPPPAPGRSWSCVPTTAALPTRRETWWWKAAIC